ncbi:MAG: YwaF family protein [Oscillospiraceae bacterium]|nr:YwaF family protein [Oscillospiraceae bacterium]
MLKSNIFKYFFVARENIPRDVGFSLYDQYHLSWLCLIALFIVIISIRYKSSQEAKKKFFRKILGSVILLSEVYYQAVLIITRQFNINYLPLHLCGISIFLCFFDSIRPKDSVREFLYCLGLPGALSALLFPNWVVYPVLNFASINSFVVHGLIIAYPVMIMSSGEFFPDYKRLPKCFMILINIAIPIYFFNKIFDTNFLFINTPSDGSPLVALETWLGNPGYILGMFVLVFICWGILYTPVLIKNLHIRHIRKRELRELAEEIY